MFFLALNGQNFPQEDLRLASQMMLRFRLQKHDMSGRTTIKKEYRAK